MTLEPHRTNKLQYNRFLITLEPHRTNTLQYNRFLMTLETDRTNTLQYKRFLMTLEPDRNDRTNTLHYNRFLMTLEPHIGPIFSLKTFAGLSLKCVSKTIIRLEIFIKTLWLLYEPGSYMSQPVYLPLVEMGTLYAFNLCIYPQQFHNLTHAVV